MCINSICRKPGRELCDVITDCGPTYGSVICNEICRPLIAEPYSPPMTECTYNTQCGRNRWCVNGICVNLKPEGGCVDHSDCPKGEKCYNEICRDIFTPVNGCLENKDCPKSHQQCYLYKCFNQRGRWCNTNKDCYAHSPICIGGICTNKILSCENNFDCPLEVKKCLRGKCTVEIPDQKCKIHKDCPKEKPFCFQGDCVYDVYEWCVDDQDCYHKFPFRTTGHCLKNNWCNSTMNDRGFKEGTPPWMSTKCRRDSDCSKTEKCLSGQCYAPELLHILCRSSADCPKTDDYVAVRMVCVFTTRRKRHVK
jgi:hypothetical protein